MRLVEPSRLGIDAGALQMCRRLSSLQVGLQFSAGRNTRRLDSLPYIFVHSQTLHSPDGPQTPRHHYYAYKKNTCD
jgi:hypothetical protein